MVEFALVMPIITIALMGAISLTRMAYDGMIMQEVADEGGKIAAIDRLDPSGTESHSMSDQEILAWMQQSAHAQDPNINVLNIAPDNGHIPWTFQNPPSSSGNAYNAIQGVLGSLSQFLHHLNPCMETMQVTYQYNSGFGPDVPVPLHRSFYFTKYQMVWVPFLNNCVVAGPAPSS